MARRAGAKAPHKPGTAMMARIAGVDTPLTQMDIPIEQIELDPTNPRIGLFVDALPKDRVSQDEIEYAILNKNPEAFEKLKASIEINKGLVNRIWIQPIGKGRFKVIEGNTRLIVYRKLHEKFLDDQVYAKIPAWVLPSDVDPKQVEFIRLEAHLRGVTPWDAYEKARYLFRLSDQDGYSVRKLSALTRMVVRDIENAISAYRTMTEQYLVNYTDPNEVLRFSYFMEYHSKPRIRDAIARSGFDVSDLCNWIGTGKLPRAADIRDLPDILDSDEAREEFTAKGYDAAMEVLSYTRPTRTSPLFSSVEKVLYGLNEMPQFELSEIRDGISPKKLELLQMLRTRIERVLRLIEGK